MKKNNELIEEYTTPYSFVFGWLCIAFGIIPLLEGTQSKNKIALYIGIGMLVIGAILLMFGKFQGDARLKKLSEKNANISKGGEAR